VETPAAFRCSLGLTKLAFQPRRLHLRWWPLALTAANLAPVTAAVWSSPRRP